MEQVGPYAVLAPLHRGWWKRVDLARRTDQPNAPLARLTRWSEASREELGDYLSPRLPALAVIHELIECSPASGLVVQPYLPGGSLELLGRRQPLEVPLGAAILAMRAMTEAMRSVLRAGVPALLDPRDVIVSWSGEQVAITDVRPYPPLLDPPTLGELRWQAPELLQRKPYGEAAAVWCIGEITFTLLAGPLFDGRPEQLLERKQRHDPPSLFERQRGDAPNAFEHLVRRAIRREPGRRPSLDDMLETLGEFWVGPGNIEGVSGWTAARDEAEARDRRALATSLPMPVGHEEILDDARLAWLRAQLEQAEELPTEILPDERLVRTQDEAEALAAEGGFTGAEAAAVVEGWRPPVDDAGELSWMSVHTSPLADGREAVEVNGYVAELDAGLVERRVVARGRRATPLPVEGEPVPLPGRAEMNTGAFRRLFDRVFRR